jgi:hypothetical protein
MPEAESFAPDLSSETASNTAVAAARTLVLDAVAIECIAALRAEDIRVILLKGPVTDRWLYSDGGLRDYIDVDLLVPRRDFRVALKTLERLGFRDMYAERTPNETPPHAHELSLQGPSTATAMNRFPNGLSVDLHWSFQGIGAPDDKLWAEVAKDAEPMSLSGTEVEVPSEQARALFVALHAARSGVSAEQPLTDLERALECVPDGVWRAAHELAVVLDAVPRFLAGLYMRPRGAELVDRLQLEGTIDAPSLLYAQGIPPVAEGVERLRTTSDPRARARLVIRELVPTRQFMKAWSPLARRGALGLMLAYCYRPVWLLVKLPAALRANARARRAVETGDLRIR